MMWKVVETPKNGYSAEFGVFETLEEAAQWLVDNTFPWADSEIESVTIERANG